MLPGEGSTDYAALFRVFKKEQYSGCDCVELSGMAHGRKEYDARGAATRCYENMKPALEKAGLR